MTGTQIATTGGWEVARYDFDIESAFLRALSERPEDAKVRVVGDEHTRYAARAYITQRVYDAIKERPGGMARNDIAEQIGSKQATVYKIVWDLMNRKKCLDEIRPGVFAANNVKPVFQNQRKSLSAQRCREAVLAALDELGDGVRIAAIMEQSGYGRTPVQLALQELANDGSISAERVRIGGAMLYSRKQN